MIELRVKDGQIHASKHDIGDESNSSSSGSSETDLLPDINKFDPQPSDNDSSDYGGENEEDPHEIDLSDDESSIALSKIKKRKRAKKGVNLSSKKSIKSAHPKMKSEVFYKKQQSQGRNDKADKSATVVK